MSRFLVGATELEPERAALLAVADVTEARFLQGVLPIGRGVGQIPKSVARFIRNSPSDDRAKEALLFETCLALREHLQADSSS